MDIPQLLHFAHQQRASDLHVSAGEPPRIRVDGEMKRVPRAFPGTAEQTQAMLVAVMDEAQKKAFAERNDLDFSLRIENVARYRVNVFRHQRGPGAVFREIPEQVPTLESLGMPRILADLTRKERGLVLVTGPTGSGKSTTLAAMVDLINRELEGHILTIEDPIEFVHQSRKCLINQREVGAHTGTFQGALRSALREDPDVILVGEMRDLETIQLALTAAETGHLVFATLHTSSAPKTVDRVIDVFPAEQQAQVRAMFAESIQAVVTQTLCKKVGGGRVAALEIMTGTTAVRNLIREGKVHQLPSVIQTSQAAGMQTLEMHLIDLVERGLITRETAVEKSGNSALGKGDPGAVARR